MHGCLLLKALGRLEITHACPLLSVEELGTRAVLATQELLKLNGLRSAQLPAVNNALQGQMVEKHSP